MKILIVGGTGFVGKSFADWVIRNNKDILVSLASRSPEKTAGSLFLKYVSNNTSVQLITINTPEFIEEVKTSDAIVYAASSSQESLYKLDPSGVSLEDLSNLESVIRLLTSRSQFIYLSSGAIYGRQLDLNPISENSSGEAWPYGSTKRVYADIKVAAERRIREASREQGFSFVIARLFAFCGAWLPTKTHFLIGNLIHSIETNSSILIKSKVPVYRSYLSADMLSSIIFDLTRLRSEQGLVLNIGSEEAYEMHDFAEKLAEVYSLPYEGKVDASALSSDIYIPSTRNLQALFELSFQEQDLFDVVASTLQLRKKLSTIELD